MILFEDDRVVAVDKAAGVSMATSTRADKSGDAAVERLLLSCGEAPDVSLRLVHRLDVGTSGVVLLAKGDAAHRDLSRAFQSGAARKTYCALVWGHPVPARGVIDASVGRDLKDGRKMRVSHAGKRARTLYATLRRLPSIADLELHPETGRTHQIRVHLSVRGHPIVGDDLYGGATRWRGVRDPARRRFLRAVERPLLHAAEVVIEELGIAVSAPLPEDYRRVVDVLARP